MIGSVNLRAVEDELNRRGYWFPPDAIHAVIEGREAYHPTDPRIRYSVDRSTSGMIFTVRAVIGDAIRSVHEDWHDPRGDVR